MSEMRKWGNATRDSNTNKPNHIGYRDILVEEAYDLYMLKHQKQADGTMRDADNWKSYFGEKHYKVCIESAYRHFEDWWKEFEGLESRDGIDEAINGLKFNIDAYYSKVLRDRLKEKNNE